MGAISGKKLYEDCSLDFEGFENWYRETYWLELSWHKNNNCQVNFYNLSYVDGILCVMIRFPRLDETFSYSYCPLKFIGE